METMGRPLVHAVIPMIDNLHRHLEETQQDATTHIAVRAGAVAGIKALNKYYSKTDDTIVYRTAMCTLRFT
jgi:ribosomal protein S15P/S13E